MKTTLTFIQFIPPNARQEEIYIELEDDGTLAAKQEAIIESGCRLTAERLQTGIVSLCIEHPDGDFACQLVPNGLGMSDAVRKLVMSFDTKAFNLWLQEVTA